MDHPSAGPAGPAGANEPWPPTSPPARHAWKAGYDDYDNETTQGNHDHQQHQHHRRHQPRPTSISGDLHQHRQHQQPPDPDGDEFKRPALPYRKCTATTATAMTTSSQQQQQCPAAAAGHLLPVQARRAKELEVLFRNLVHNFHASAPHHLRTGAPAAAADGSGDRFAPTTTSSSSSALSAAVTTTAATSRWTQGRGHAGTSGESRSPFSPARHSADPPPPPAAAAEASSAPAAAPHNHRPHPPPWPPLPPRAASTSRPDWHVLGRTRGCNAPPRPPPAPPAPAAAAPNTEGLGGHTLDMLAQGVETATTRCTTAWSSPAFWSQQFASCRPIMKNSSSSAAPLPPATTCSTNVAKSCDGAGWNSPGRSYDQLLQAASPGLRFPASSSAAASADAARGFRKRKRLEATDDEEEPIVITMAPAAAPVRAGAAMSGQAVITIPRTYTHETASNLFVFAELTGARKRDIALSFDEGALRLMASRQPSLAPASGGEGGWEGEEGANYMVTVPLPPWVDDWRMRRVKITFSTGLLELCIPKDLAQYDDDEEEYPGAAAGEPPINAVVTVSGIGAGLTSVGREPQQRWRPSGHQVDQATLTAPAEPAAGFLFPAHSASAYAEAVGHSTPPTERRVH